MRRKINVLIPPWKSFPSNLEGESIITQNFRGYIQIAEFCAENK